MNKIVGFILVLTIFVLSSCKSNLPEKSSANYGEAVKSFYVGLVAMQAANDERAKTELEKVVKLAEGEPAAWANLGVLQMRQKDFENAFKSLEKARNLAPENAQIYSNLAVLEIQRGNFGKVKENLQKAIETNPNDSKAVFALAAENERDGNDAEALALYEKILQSKPENLPVILEIIRLSAKRNETEKLKTNFAKIKPREDVWGDEIKEQFASLQASVNSGNAREVAQKIAFFRNVLLRLPEFRGALADVKFSDTTIGEPFLKPLKLPVPDFSPAAPDESLTFKTENVSTEKAIFGKAVFLDGDSAPINAFASEKEIKLGEKSLPVSNAKDLQTLDIDYNFKNDFVASSEKGLQFFKDDLSEITANTKLSNDILHKKISKIFTFDIEIDGDLDLVLAVENSAPIVLQNNADGTFKEIKVFGELNNLRDFVSADFDEDGDIDAAILNGNSKLNIFSNERGGQFKLRNAPVSSAASAIYSADSNGDGKLDLNILQADGNLIRATDKNDGKDWETVEILKSETIENPTLIIQDFDNNGASDVLISNRVWLGGKDGKFNALSTQLNGKVSSAADFNSDGKLDLSGIDADGKAATFLNQSAKNYAWQIIRPRSAKAEGDQRVNSFGIGGEMEIRAGLLAQKRVISAPQVHFGLGEQTATDLLRIVWGNGFIQAEFDLQKDQQILVKQRLTGSCPHLFAWNGTEFKLVKDSAPLATSLGLRVSDEEILSVTQTEEWYKISGEKLAPRDGFYELRITDELWESYYVDHYSLVAIDHPLGTEIFANELYPVPVPLKLHLTSNLKPFASATDESGNDVSNLVENLDEIHLDTFADGRFQGVAKEHFVELVLPENVSNESQLNIVADGWLHPTDTSLNVAISQSGFEKPKSLSLDVSDESGNWKTVKDDFGVPAGKLKTIVVELPNGTKRARLRTNMEIFWDRLAWAESVSESENVVQKIELSNADLAFRGFSEINKKDESSPEIPDYNRIATTIERWRSIEGYYTRYGEILELLTKTDDRYAIVASGDEIRLKFPALAPVKQGFVRDFVIVGNGWIKEGDYNNLFSKTILPLPTHATNDYSRKPTILEDDPVYQKNKMDWLNFHTRYVAPDSFRNAMRR
ncbi:MAG: FG-GAP-like repeat-containing protein [Pyrinomonadaceae bacterium]|nr:FG-GAP-like repeat-containing protein [Pyrinomonadaceae bacterium]